LELTVDALRTLYKNNYIEEIFGLNPKTPTEDLEVKLIQNFDSTAITKIAIRNAKEVSILFYNSNVWKNLRGQYDHISLNGYIQIVAK